MPLTPATPGADLLLAARARGITLLALLAVPSSPQARAGG
jgi:hypothetical protein